MKLIDIDSEAFLTEMRGKQDAVKDLIKEADREHQTWTEWDHWNSVYGVFVEIAITLRKQPTIEAVPLDALCEWMASWDIQVIPCNVCKHVFQLESCPHGPFDCGDSEHLKMLIRKWMEGQHDHN